MQIILIGDDTQHIDLAAAGDGLSARCTAELTSALADYRFCLFDRRNGVDPRNLSAEFRQQFENSDAAAVIVPYSCGDWLNDLRELPARLQSLVPHLTEAGALAIAADRLSRALPFQDTANPVQDALIRLIANQPKFRIRIGDGLLLTNDTAQSLPELVPGMSPGADPRMQQHLARFIPEELAPVESAPDAVALIAGLFQMHDCLDRSHSLSQTVEGQGRHAAGDYWHAIMHRREPDYGNSKYWYRHVGCHPVFDELAQRATEELASMDDPEAPTWSDRICGGGAWNAFAWVDFCEHVAPQRTSALHDVARRIQWLEMLLLLRQTAEDAYGAG